MLRESRFLMRYCKHPLVQISKQYSLWWFCRFKCIDITALKWVSHTASTRWSASSRGTSSTQPSQSSDEWKGDFFAREDRRLKIDTAPTEWLTCRLDRFLPTRPRLKSHGQHRLFLCETVICRKVWRPENPTLSSDAGLLNAHVVCIGFISCFVVVPSTPTSRYCKSRRILRQGLVIKLLYSSFFDSFYIMFWR